MNKMETKKYIDCILAKNSIDKLLPMTHKNNHKIPLDIWKDRFLAFGVDVKLQNYTHLRSDGKHFQAVELVVA